jgi:hypothetical protein
MVGKIVQRDLLPGADFMAHRLVLQLPQFRQLGESEVGKCERIPVKHGIASTGYDRHRLKSLLGKNSKSHTRLDFPGGQQRPAARAPYSARFRYAACSVYILFCKLWSNLQEARSRRLVTIPR